jgi:hypothetical protein
VNCEEMIYASYLECETVVVSVLRSVVRRRQVERENWKVCKSARALYYLCVSVIMSECVTQLLINPIMRTRTRLISDTYHYTRHNIYLYIHVSVSPVYIYVLSTYIIFLSL